MATKIHLLSKLTNYELHQIETANLLQQFAENLRVMMINLLTEGQMKEWGDEQNIGDTYTFSDELFLDSGDKNVNLLFNLLMEVEGVLGRIENEGLRRKYERFK